MTINYHVLESNIAEDPLNGFSVPDEYAPFSSEISHKGDEESEFEEVTDFNPSHAEAEGGFNADFSEVYDSDKDVPHIGTLYPSDFDSLTVCDRDDRVNVDSKKFPFRATCQLEMMFNSIRFYGTGWFISFDTIATCGHCVFSHANGGWADSIKVMPGRDGKSLPFGSDYASQLYSVVGWTRDKRQDFDYGFIKLATPTLGKRVGYYGFGYFPNSFLLGSRLNNVGYPGDKPRGTSWFNAGRATNVQPHKLYYMIDTAGGQSGSSVYTKHGNDPYIGTAVHGYGGCPNSARRIDKHAYANFKKVSGR